MTEKSQLQVEAIRNGSVIDHIPAGQGINILKLFHCLDHNERITVDFNLPSKALGHKDIIKVVKKHNLSLPQKISHVFSCPNSNCITHFEPAATSEFKIVVNKGRVQLKCKYCERVFNKEIVTDSI